MMGSNMEKDTAEVNPTASSGEGRQATKDTPGKVYTTCNSLYGSNRSVDFDGSKTATVKASSTSNNEPEKVDYTVKAQNKTKFSDYLRIFSYSTTTEKIFLGIATIAEIGYVLLIGECSGWNLNNRHFVHVFVTQRFLIHVYSFPC
jgi:hypothetical protein